MTDIEPDFGGLGLPAPAVRDGDLEEMKAIDVAIANFVDVGQQPTPHLLMLRNQIRAKLSRERGTVFEHAAEEPLLERAVPSKPARPRKPNADIAPGS